MTAAGLVSVSVSVSVSVNARTHARDDGLLGRLAPALRLTNVG